MSKLNTSLGRLTIGLSATTILAMGTAAYAQTAPHHDRAVYYRYDGQGRMVGEIQPDPDGDGPLKRPATRTTYDPNGLVVRVETGTLDSWQANSIAPQSWTGFTILQTVRNSYDTIGQLVKAEVVGGDNVTVSVVQTNYDRIGRPGCTAVRMNPAEFNSLPGNACDLDTPGALGPDRITRNFYDVAGQMIQMRMAHGTSQEIAEVSYTYTPNGKQQFVIDANGNRAEMRYDGFDRLQRWIFPSTARASNFSWSNVVGSTPDPNPGDYEEYTYDRNGNRTRLRKRDGQEITFQYDALNRVTRKVIPARAGLDAIQARSVTYTYDLRDLVLSTTFDNASGPGQRVTYNGFGEPTEIADNSTGVSRSLRYGYDANGNRTDMWYPDNQRFTFEYDTLDRLTHLRHNGSDRLVQQRFNDRGLLERLKRNGASEQFQDFLYDQVGRLTSYSIEKGASQYDVEWTFQRNAASQITQETRSNDEFAWDGAVNITRNYTTNGLNQYTQASSAQATDNFCYDANGNLTADADEVFKYDVENRMVEKRARVAFTTCPNPLSNGGYEGALIARLDYDPLGRLYRVTGSSNNATLFVHDGNAMIAEYAPTGSLLQRYLHGTNVESDDPLVWYPGGDVTLANMRNLYTDQRGSIAFVSDINGTKVALNTFDEYGNNGTQNAGRFQFTGQVWLEEAQLYYYKARIYSPKLGRFLQVDPVGYEDQYNLYAYVGNDPINKIDPSGKRCVVANGWSNYCRRATLYAAFDRVLAAHTRFFAAAAATSSFLANNDLPVASNFFGLKDKSEEFLRGVANSLEGLNSSIAKRIEAGQSSVSGRALDRQLVRREQTEVQRNLDSLPASDRSEIVTDINQSFQFAINNPDLFRGSRADRAYVDVLRGVQKNLGEQIDFGNYNHRVAIGDALVARARGFR